MATVEKETARLCTKILHEHFGDIPSRVGSTLLLQGRLPLLRIARSILIKPQRVAHALVILIQHNLVWHWESASGSETFEINHEEVLARLRYGRYIAFAEELFGESAVAIISLLIDEGRVRGDRIVQHLVPLANDLKARKLMERSLIDLAKEGYIKPTSPILQRSPTDRLLQYEEDATISLRAQPGTKKGPLAAKDLLEVKAAAKRRLEAEVLAIENSGLTRIGTTSSSKSSKKSKATADEDTIDGDLYFRISPQKFNIHIRNQIFVTSATQRFNESAGRVLAGALVASLPSERSPYSYRSESLTFNTLSRAIPSASSPTPLTSHAGSNGNTNGNGATSSSSKLTGLQLSKRLLSTIDKDDETALKMLYVREYINILCAADNPSETGRQSAFLSLTLSGTGGGGGSGGNGKRVSVEYEVIARRLRAQVLENSVRDKWGVAGIRIVKILRDCGKLDSEQIAKRAMLKKVDVQKYLKDMSTEGLVSSIELARSADRAASRAIYLWYIDTPRTYSSLLYSLYRTLSNILARLEHETSAVQSILEKRSRTDVQVNPEQYLTFVERASLEAYEVKREKLRVLMARVDESCFVLRDLAKEGFIQDDPFVPQPSATT